MAGSVFVPGKNTIQISYAGNGYHMVGEMDPEQIPPCNTLVPPENLPPLQGGEIPGMAGAVSQHVDVMVLYTAAARNGAGGTAAMQSLIDLAVAEANEAYSNSDITNELNLVYRGEVVYTESGNAVTDLNRLQATADGQLDSI